MGSHPKGVHTLKTVSERTDEIEKAVCETLCVQPTLLRGYEREDHAIAARKIWYLLLMKRLGWGYSAVARHVSRDHSSVMSLVKNNSLGTPLLASVEGAIDKVVVAPHLVSIIPSNGPFVMALDSEHNLWIGEAIHPKSMKWAKTNTPFDTKP